MEAFKISITEQPLNLLGNPDADIANMLTTLFRPSSKNFDLLAFELQREFRQGGSPDVTRLSFDRTKFDYNSGSGSFRALVDIRFTFGCEDSTTEKKDQTSEWTFAFDKASGTINFYSSPFAESRSTADEF